jgi:hypothetical protein
MLGKNEFQIKDIVEIDNSSQGCKIKKILRHAKKQADVVL